MCDKEIPNLVVRKQRQWVVQESKSHPPIQSSSSPTPKSSSLISSPTRNLCSSPTPKSSLSISSPTRNSCSSPIPKSSSSPSRSFSSLMSSPPQEVEPRRSLTGLMNASLPQINPNHDLKDKLEQIIVTMERGSGLFLNPLKLSNLLRCELSRWQVSEIEMARKLNVGQDFFNVYFNTKHINRHQLEPVHLKVYYHAFLWLALPQLERLSVFYPVLQSNNISEVGVNSLPKVDILLPKVREEMSSYNISFLELGETVLGCDWKEAAEVVEVHLPWELMPFRRKKMFAELWFWMKQSRNTRLWCLRRPLTVMEESEESSLDLSYLCNNVVQFLQDNGKSIASLAEKLESVQVSENDLEMMLRYPQPWCELSEEEKSVYVKIMVWASLSDEAKLSGMCSNGDTAPVTQIDTAELARKFQAQVRQKILTQKQFADIVGVNRNYLCQLLKYPSPWSSTTPKMKQVYRKINSWLLSDDAERARFLQQPVLSVKTTPKKKQEKITGNTKEMLLTEFSRNPRPSLIEMKEMAEELDLMYLSVVRFFSNKRKAPVMKTSEEKIEN